MNKKFIIPLLVILAFIILGIPLFIYGIDQSFFYSIDPDIVYVTNALLYTKYAIIDYADHPGTPTIMILYYLYFPLRIIAKYWLHVGFIQWSFDNFAFLMFYSRIFELLVFCSSLLIFLKAVSKMIKSNLLVIIAWISIFIFLGFDSGVRVIPENFSFFLTAIWLLLFLKFVEKRSYIYSALMVFIAGFAVANKFTSLFLLVQSIFLPIFINKLKLDQLYARVQINVFIAGLAFYIGILPALERLPWIKSFAISLFSHAGAHGTGESAIFNLPAYSASITSLITRYPATFMYIFLTFVLAIFLIVKKKVKLNDPALFVFATTLVGIFVFAKYSAIHYFYVNFVLVVFCAIYFLTKVKQNYLKYVLVTVSAVFLVLFNPFTFIKNISNQMPTNKTETVYSTLRTWTPFWASDIFGDQFKAIDSIKTETP
jgi:hypothetical protein